MEGGFKGQDLRSILCWRGLKPRQRCVGKENTDGGRGPNREFPPVRVGSFP